jgi:hypothetical protein
MEILNHTSIYPIVEAVYRNTGVYDIPLEEVVEHIPRAIAKLGISTSYITKVTSGVDGSPEPIEISEHRGELPNDVLKIDGIKEYYSRKALIKSTDIYFLDPNPNTVPVTPTTVNTDDYVYPPQNYNDWLSNQDIMQRYMTSYSGLAPSFPPIENELKYKIENGVIYTNFHTGKIIITYKTFATDDNGYPLIPDNEKYKEFIELYLQERIDYKLWRQDKLSDKVYQDTRQRYLFAIKSAKSHLSIPDVDQMESLKNLMLRLVPDKLAHKTGFKYNSERERYWKG